MLVAIGGAVVFQLSQTVGNNIPRVPGVFGQLPANERPADQAATTFLIVGSDSRSPEPTTGTDAACRGEARICAQRRDHAGLGRGGPDERRGGLHPPR